MGSTSRSPSLVLPCQANTAGDHRISLLESDFVCAVSQLLAVQEGGATIPWEQRYQQNKGIDSGAARYQATPRVQHQRISRCSLNAH